MRRTSYIAPVQEEIPVGVAHVVAASGGDAEKFYTDDLGDGGFEVEGGTGV